MSVTVALLHAVNVGGHNRVAMSELRTALAKAELPGARTYVQSGNIVVDAALSPEAVRARIEAVLADHFSVTTTALCRTGDQWAAIVAGNPFPQAAAAPANLAVLFSRRPATAEQIDTLDAARKGEEAFKVTDYATYLHLPAGQGRSRLAATASTLFKADATMRNWRTVLALKAMTDELKGAG